MAIDLPHTADVVIVGAGPAGLSAATYLRRAGVASVLVLDREAVAGGIPRHCGHYPYGVREFRRLMRGPDYAARLVAEALAAGVIICCGVTVLGLHDGPEISVTSDAGPGRIAAKRVLLATGVRETSRAARQIGGTKPGGVLSTGALQGLVYLDGMRPFVRPVILGSELVALSAIQTCRHMGIRPVAVIEPAAHPTARWPLTLYPRLMGIPLLLNTSLVEIEGIQTVTGVVLRDGQGATRRIATDGVIVSGQFRPEATLLHGHLTGDPKTRGPVVDAYGRCSDPAYFAAGNLLRAVETAGACWAEGRAVAQAIWQSLQGQLPEPGQCRVAVQGDELAYVMPQTLGAGNDPAFGMLQLRVTRAVRGDIVVHRAGLPIARHAIASRPERRITLPLPSGDLGDLILTFEAAP